MTFYERLTNRENNPNSAIIKNIFDEEKSSMVMGLVKVSLDYDILKIQYSGKHTDTFDHINSDLLSLKLPSIDELKKLFIPLDEMGNPNYFYVIRFQV